MKNVMRSALLLSLLALPGTAAAQTPALFVSPYLGWATSGGDLAESGAKSMGVSAGWMGSKWGVEVDVADTHGFFEQTGFLTERRVTTAMVNGLVGLPLGSMLSEHLKVFGAAGYGMIQPKLTEAGGLAALDTKQGGFNVGGGATWMKGAVGLRGDVRYFRSVGDDEDDLNAFGLKVSELDFVRVSVGMVVGF